MRTSRYPHRPARNLVVLPLEHLPNVGRARCPHRADVPIKSWDETYVHEKHNTNRVVLAERVEGEHHEPNTWVRTSGKGRVFYTAWGHDQRTWSNANFLRMVINAIEWTSMPSPNHLTPHAGLPPFKYTNSPAGLPNYLAGARWGTQGEPIRTMQEPLSPEESMKHLVLLPGFQAKLFAAEPQVTKPICMQWDARGRLWIAETVDYPNQMQPLGQGHDRIKICEDTDGDGRADKFTIFADKLSTSGTSIMPNGFESLSESDLSALLAYLAVPATEADVAAQSGESARK